jgi:hypothetical protein
MKTNRFYYIKSLCLFLFAALFSCGSNKQIQTNSETQLVSCPENGICTFELLQNKRLEIKNDAFGKTYYSLEDDTTKNTIRYIYNLKNDKNIQDSSYREEVVFEFNASETELNLLDTKLQDSKMLFGRFCFCRGATGYYKVKEGNLKLKKNNETYQLDFDFKINEVPQIISKISGVVK